LFLFVTCFGLSFREDGDSRYPLQPAQQVAGRSSPEASAGWLFNELLPLRLAGQLAVGSDAMLHYVYILRNASGKQYVGQTADIEARLKEHNEGSVTATKKLRTWHVEWFCCFNDKKRAIEFEKYLKSGSGSSIRFRHIAPK
jgi:predicted GIY-YIG superfamily endonuclease